MRRLWPLLAILLLASILRLYHLGIVDLRGDEAFAVVFSAMPLREMFAGLARTEPNPPLYWLLLRYWQWIAGNSEFAVRLPSAWAGVTTAALTHRLTWVLLPFHSEKAQGSSRKPQGGSLQRRASNCNLQSAICNLAAFLAALNPFLIWHSQDARVYSLLAALVTAATWLTLDPRTFQRFGARTILAVALWWLALFAHYFAAFALAAAIAAVLITPDGRRYWRVGLTALAVLGFAYLPWALYVAPLMLGHTKAWIVPTNLADAFLRTFVAFVGGTTLTELQRIFAGVLGGGLAVGGIGLAIWRWQIANGELRTATPHFSSVIRCSQSAICHLPSAIPLALLPPLLLGLLSLWRPAFDERFIIGSLPALLILLALPITYAWTTRRPLALLALGPLLVLTTVSLANYYLLPAFRKSPRWRDLTAYLAVSASPQDVILQDLNDPAFDYYYRGAAQVVTPPVNQQSAISSQQLETLVSAHPRLWLLLTDSTGPASDWLDDHAERLSDEWVYGFRLQVFDSPAGSLAAMTPFEAEFEGGIRLAGYRLYRPDLTGLKKIHLTLYWQAQARVAGDYAVFTHLVAADGFQVAGHDSPPDRGRKPTSSWRSGEIIIDPHDLTLPSDLAPGAYRLAIGLYDPTSLARLPVVDSDAPSPPDSVILPPSIATY